MRSLRVLPLLLATAAFSECGDNALDVILEPARLAEVSPVTGSTALDCRIRLAARLGGTGEGREARWTSLYVTAVDQASGARVAEQLLDADGAAALFGAARIPRGEVQQMELELRIPAPAFVHFNLGYQVLPSEGLFLDGNGSTHLAVACGARA